MTGIFFRLFEASNSQHWGFQEFYVTERIPFRIEFHFSLRVTRCYRFLIKFDDLFFCRRSKLDALFLVQLSHFLLLCYRFCDAIGEFLEFGSNKTIHLHSRAWRALVLFQRWRTRVVKFSLEIPLSKFMWSETNNFHESFQADNLTTSIILLTNDEKLRELFYFLFFFSQSVIWLVNRSLQCGRDEVVGERVEFIPHPKETETETVEKLSPKNISASEHEVQKKTSFFSREIYGLSASTKLQFIHVFTLSLSSLSSSILPHGKHYKIT